MSTTNIPDQKAFEAEVQRRVNSWQAETLFPAELLPGGFPDMVWACFRFNSAFDLRMHAEHYKALTEKTEGYTYLDISEIGLVCKKRNAAELALSKEQYNEFQMAVEEVIRHFLRLSTEQQEAIQKKLVVTMKVEKTVPDSKKTINFPMAQA